MPLPKELDRLTLSLKKLCIIVVFLQPNRLTWWNAIYDVIIVKIVIFHYFRHFFSSLESSFVDAIISFLQYFLSLIKRRFPWLIQFSPREEGGKKGKNAKYSHFHQGQVPLEQKPSWTTSRNFFKNFTLYINVLRIRFGVETTLTDRYFDIWMD